MEISCGDSAVVGLHALMPEGPGSIPGWETKIPQAMQHGQKKRKKVCEWRSADRWSARKIPRWREMPALMLNKMRAQVAAVMSGSWGTRPLDHMGQNTLFLAEFLSGMCTVSATERRRWAHIFNLYRDAGARGVGRWLYHQTHDMISFEQTVPWFKKNFFLQTNDLQKPSVLEKLLHLQVRENYYGDLNCDPPKFTGASQVLVV